LIKVNIERIYIEIERSSSDCVRVFLELPFLVHRLPSSREARKKASVNLRELILSSCD
jgi:hypothetical protein